jgi:ribonuclease R
VTDPADPPRDDEILEFLRARGGPVAPRDVFRHFGVASDGRRGVRERLAALMAAGTIEPGPGRTVVARSAALPEIAPLDILRRGPDGTLIARLADARGGASPTIVVERGPGPAAGPGERVLASLAKGRDGHWHARVLRRLDRAAETIVGVFEGTAKGGFLRPVDRRQRETPTVGPAEAAGLKPGDLVRARLIRDRPLAAPRAQALERFGNVAEPRAVSLVAIHQHGIPTEFPAAALALAAGAEPVGPEGREDVRALPLVTIDGADARDFDDAVFAEPDPDPAHRGGWRLVVAIADVAHYVRPGDALDREAEKRGNSVYFPDRVVPMLPEKLSNDLCSLRPAEDRACLVADMRIDAEGRLQRHRFARALMRSAARLTYEQVQAAMDGAPDGATAPLLDRALRPLYGAYAALAAARRRRGALDIDLPERKVELGADGRVARVAPVRRLDSHRLIEEFMILANVAAAETLEARRMPCVYRVHEKPDVAKLEALRPVLRELGLPLPPQGVRPADFNRVLAMTRDTPHQRLVHEMVLRSQMQARYGLDNLGHFGLALARYAHFTSPIRRYSDLLVHRALLGPGAAGGVGREAGADWARVADHISDTERRGMAAERDAQERYVSAFMAGRVGAEFSGTVTGVARFGLFIKLDDTGAEGLLPVEALPQDRYWHEPERQTLAGRHGGPTFRLGDGMTVRLAEADAVTGSLAFAFVAHRPAGGDGKAPRGPSMRRVNRPSRGRR